MCHTKLNKVQKSVPDRRPWPILRFLFSRSPKEAPQSYRRRRVEQWIFVTNLTSDSDESDPQYLVAKLPGTLTITTQ